MTPAPHPEGTGLDARPAGLVPSPHPRDRPSTSRSAPANPAPGHLAPTGTDGPLQDLVGFTPEELRVVAAVAALGPALGPSPSARERMRARVLAAAGTDDTAVNLSPPPTTRTADATLAAEVVELAGRRRRGLGVRGRFLVAAAAALCLVVALSGISLVLSRDALPGDALYSLKRAGETTQLELTFSDTDRGLRHLDYAGRRVDELAALVDRGRTTALGGQRGGVALAAVDQVDPATAASLLDDLDSEAAAGSSLLTAVGVAGDPTALGSLSTWAQGQSARLTALRSQLPPDAQSHTDSSLVVLDQVRARADTLAARLSCSPITTGGSDDLGPLPATACTAPDGSAVLSSGAPTRPTTTPAPSGSSTAAGSPQGGSASSSAPAPGGAAASRSSGPGATGGAAPGGVATTVPALPTTPRIPLPGPSAPALPLPPLPTISVPVPLLPPITIGPILPGLPPITIGG